jgi:Sugar-binding N-terminal domain
MPRRPARLAGQDGAAAAGGERAVTSGRALPELLASLPPPGPDDGSRRDSIRAARSARGLLLGVLDDDPTGSQAVHDIEVVTVLDEDAYSAALAGPAGICLVLTNSRGRRRGDCRRRLRATVGGAAAGRAHPVRQPRRFHTARQCDR